MSATYPDMAGRVAIVTGGSRGIGAETCRVLAANGVKVVVNGRDQKAIDSVVESIRSTGAEAIGIAADCTDFAAIERMREQAERELGPIDLLMAFAGGGDRMPTEQISEEQWRFVVDANLTATFLTVKSVLPGMIERHSGAIVTMASAAGRMPSLASAAYAAAKAGIVMLSKHLANEFGSRGIRVNCIAPSAIMNERMNSMSEQQKESLAASFPLGRIGLPDDVAQAALFLASDSASWLTGVTLDVAGGRIIV